MIVVTNKILGRRIRLSYVVGGVRLSYMVGGVRLSYVVEESGQAMWIMWVRVSYVAGGVSLSCVNHVSQGADSQKNLWYRNLHDTEN